jgi:ABC-type transport system substrate-binding protein
VPTVTCLVPNPQHPLLAARTFRRALVVGINRQAILEQLLKGSAARGDRVVSAPLPAPRNADDPLGYAYNKSIDPRPYHPWLAMTLVSLTLKQAQEKEKADAVQAAKAAQQAAPNPQGAGNQVAAPGAAQPSPAPAAPPTAPARPAEPTEPPGPSKVEQALAKPLVLAHPPHDVARVACRAIQRQLHLVGLMVELRELSPASPASEDVALRYTEVFMQEPLIDVQRLFGQGGIAPHGNPYLRLALRELERSPDWRRAHEKLNDIHRLVHEDATVIPLWQISEHLAHHKALQGTASQPLTLYQQIEQWQSPPAVLPDSP